MNRSTFTLIPAALLLCVALALVPGCVSDAQLAAWKEQQINLAAEVDTLKTDLVALPEGDPLRQRIVDALTAAEPYLAALDEKIATAQTGKDVTWGIVETIVGVVAGFFPPVAILVPIITRLRRIGPAVFNSIRAGGGPANPVAAKLALQGTPGEIAYAEWKATLPPDPVPGAPK